MNSEMYDAVKYTFTWCDTSHHKYEIIVISCYEMNEPAIYVKVTEHEWEDAVWHEVLDGIYWEAQYRVLNNKVPRFNRFPRDIAKYLAKGYALCLTFHDYGGGRR